MARNKDDNQGNENEMQNMQNPGVEHITRVTVGKVVYAANQEKGEITVQIDGSEEEVLEPQEITNLQAMFGEFKSMPPQ